ncbi:uncharacterized protein LOC144356999 [Saccoglossus kowalevskii]
MDHVIGSKLAINELNRLGFFISYDEVTRFKQNVVQNINVEDVLSCHPAGSFTQWIADNVDHNIVTIDGKHTFHGMDICLSDNSSTPDDRRVTDDNIADTEVWEDAADISEVMHFNEIFIDHDNSDQPGDSEHSSLMKAMFMYIFSWQNIHGVSDRGIQCLVTFIKHVLVTIATVFKVDRSANFCKLLPGTLHTIRKCLGLSRDNFKQYVVCPKCHSIYPYENCFKVKSTGEKISMKCSNIEFPQHPHQSRRRPCGEVLLKQVKGQNGQQYLYPKQVYTYRSVILSLETYVKRRGFIDACNKWRTRSSPENSMGDIYDGQVWKDFQSQGYFRSRYDLSLTLNVDWFQPYDHTPHSLGAIYLVINNLPRQERFLPNNMILVGLLPGPKEPKKHMNSYMEPLVAELQQLSTSVKMKDESSIGNIYRAEVMCISSDIPATRKCGGFVGHGALRGCSKCLTSFPREEFGAKADYSNFDDESYPPRSDGEHKEHAYRALMARTQADQTRIEREYGARWTHLNYLKYFQPVRFHVVDPMHNLLLGTAKNVIKTWKTLSVIDDTKMETIQDRVDKMTVPSHIGRIPRKIAAGFSGFTADQWRNWVAVFSIFALKDVIPDEHYKCWQIFVEACTIVCARKITIQDAYKAHALLKDFCKTFANLYGKEHCTINMHMHMHLIDSILNFGPVYGFWCFSFERFNGILGSFPNNKHSITVQLMRRFLQDQQVSDMHFPTEFSDMQCIDLDSSRGTLSEMRKVEPDHSVYLTCTSTDIDVSNITDSNVTALPPESKFTFDKDDTLALNEMYAKLYPSHRCIILQIAECYKRQHKDNPVPEDDTEHPESSSASDDEADVETETTNSFALVIHDSVADKNQTFQ